MFRSVLRSPFTPLFVLMAACGDNTAGTVSTGSSESGDTSTTSVDSTTTEAPTTGEPTGGTTTTSTTTDTSTGTTTTTTDTSTTAVDTTTTGSTTDTTTGSTTDTSTSSTTGDVLCGNGAVDDGETCDGADLAGQDCVMQGFDAGTLACTADCASFDVAGCTMFSCGNEMVEGNEICDGADLAGQDCVMQGFDGGALACMDNCGGFDTAGCYKCGDDVIAGPELCDGADLGGADCVSQGFDGGTLACAADCSALDTSACFTCGDGKIGGTEQCDGADLGGATCMSQGADFGTLGCAADCTFDLAGCTVAVDESEPNDDTMVAVATNDFSVDNADGPFTSDTLISAAISPAGDDDIFAVTNPSAGYALLKLETFGPDGPPTCANIDTLLEIRTAANTVITSNDDGGVDACSLITNFLLGPNQTVYVRVIEFGDNDPIAGYYLDIQIDPVVCGDGAAGPGEQCDDGNVVGGDGCSATCVLEAATQEIEPNNTNAEADATGLVSTGNSLYGGSINPIGDVDRYRVDLAAPQFLRFETFSSLNDCTATTTNLRLFDAVDAPVIADTAASGILGCSALVFPLPAGTFYVQVEETGNDAPVPSYLLEARTLGDFGVETEPNEDQLTANTNIQAAGSDVYVYGDHAVNADSDYYAIDVPVAGSSIRLEVIEGDRAVETCESNGIDSRVTLYDSNGVQLANDDDTGRGWCSLIDGTGTTPLNAGAHNLAAGTYYAQVRASAAAQNGAAGQFIYRLVATVRTP